LSKLKINSPAISTFRVGFYRTVFLIFYHSINVFHLLCSAGSRRQAGKYCQKSMHPQINYAVQNGENTTSTKSTGFNY